MAHPLWPFEPAFFLSDTADLTPEEGWAYFKLLCFYWMTRSLPNDDRRLAHIAGMDLRTWKRHYRRRLQKFFHSGWKHKRMERDLRAAAAYHQQKRRAANARWHPTSQPVDNGEAAVLSSNYPSPRKKPKQYNGTTHAPAYAAAMPLKSKITTSPFGTGRSADVDNLQNLAHTSAVVYHGNSLQPAKQSPQYRRAQQRLLGTLLADLGERAFAELIEVFASNADLLHRATVAEQRKPNSGAAFIVTSLRVR